MSWPADWRAEISLVLSARFFQPKRALFRAICWHDSRTIKCYGDQITTTKVFKRYYSLVS
ncbi:hypothetical protein HMPREF0880_04349 [Yokenella regensburgei ATCC 43003]|nr:hypothetical protein HMPREF0880_04349 [Yokenella regensburgei ATCC 43003]